MVEFTEKILDVNKVDSLIGLLAEKATAIKPIKVGKFFIDFYGSGNLVILTNSGYSLEDSDLEFIKTSIGFINKIRGDTIPRVRIGRDKVGNYLLRISNSVYYYNQVGKFFQYLGSKKKMVQEFNNEWGE